LIDNGTELFRIFDFIWDPRCDISWVPIPISTPGTEAKNLLTSEAQEE
jgi:hypothetical protein